MKRGLNQLDSQPKINAIFKKKQVEDKDVDPVAIYIKNQSIRVNFKVKKLWNLIAKDNFRQPKLKINF